MATYIQRSNGSDAFASGFSSTAAIVNTTNNIIVVACWSETNSVDDCNITDTLGTTFTRVISLESATLLTTLELWFGVPSSEDINYVVTNTPTSGANSGLIINEWNGQSGSPLDTAAGNAPVDVAVSFTSTSFTTTQEYEVLFCAALIDNSLPVGTLSVGSGWSNLSTENTIPGFQMGFESRIVATSGSYNGAMTCSTPKRFYECVAMGLKFVAPSIRVQATIMG